MKYPQVVRPKKINSHIAVRTSRRRGIGLFQRYSASDDAASSDNVITGNRPQSRKRPENSSASALAAPHESNFQTSSHRQRLTSPLASSMGTTNHASRMTAGIRIDAARTTRRERSPLGPTSAMIAIERIAA